MKMKKLLVLVLALALVLSACATANQNAATTENVNVYFALKGNSGLGTEQRSIQYASADEKYKKTIEEWIKGPADTDKFEISLSDTIKLSGTSIEQDKLTVDFNQDFNFGGVMHEAAVIASLVDTMVQFPEVNFVRITIKGKDLVAPSGSPYGYMSEIDFNPNAVIEGKEVTLYFGDDQAMYVVAEKRVINIEENAPKDKLVRALIEELTKGPESTELTDVIPEEARINLVIVGGERATIDFSEEMYTKHSHGAAGERMTLSSIANTLTEIPGITEVVLTLNGKPLNLEHVIIDSSNPLRRDEDIILKK
jgi:germination protein M